MTSKKAIFSTVLSKIVGAQRNLTNHIVSFILEFTASKMATIEEAFDVVRKTFGISTLNAPQKNGITKIVEEGRDFF